MFDVVIWSQYYFGVLFSLMVVFGTWRRDVILTVVLFTETIANGMLVNGNIKVYVTIHIITFTSLFVFAYARDVMYRVSSKQRG